MIKSSEQYYKIVFPCLFKQQTEILWVEKITDMEQNKINIMNFCFV